MARYEQLQVRKDALFLDGSPVTIAAEALLADNKAKTLSAQVKFANVGSRDIDTLVAEYRPIAAMGRELEPVVHQYRFDGATPGSEFGQSEPVKLPAETVDFSSRVLRVGFANGDTWDAPEDSEWKKLPGQENLSKAIGNERLLKQYAISVGAGLTFVAREFGLGSWICGCGTLNGPGRATCLGCGKSLSIQLSHLDKALLDREATEREEEERAEAERQARLAAERAAREAEEAERKRIEEAEEAERKRIEEERLAAEREAKNKRARKALAIMCAIAALATAAFVAYNNVIVPSQRYDAAIAMVEEGELDEAIEEFSALGDYKDSQTKVKECQYDQATALMENGDYSGAGKVFEELGDYEDSQARLKECKYVEASLLMEDGDYSGAMKAFEELGDYEDSQARLKECQQAAEEAQMRGVLEDLQIYDANSNKSDKAAWYLSQHLNEYEVLSQAEVEALFPGTYGWMTIDYYADVPSALTNTPLVRTFNADGTYNAVARKELSWSGANIYTRITSIPANYEIRDGKLVMHPFNNETIAVYEVREVFDGFYVFVRRGGNYSQVSDDGQLAGAMYAIDVDSLQFTR